ncbi:MAG: ATP-binding protein [Planctomycetota bacterium]|jgi:PAS domain S-box-containing protein
MNLEKPDSSKNARLLFRPYIIVFLTLIPLVISLLILYLNLSRIIKGDIEHQKNHTEQLQQQEIIAKLQARIETAYSIVEHYYSANLGQENCKTALDKLRFDGNNYIWVHQLDPKRLDSALMLVHADKSLINRDLSGLIDLDRLESLYLHGSVYPIDSETVIHIQPTNIFEQFNQVCLKNGSGVVRYYWPKIIEGQAEKVGYLKVSYVQYFPEWNWVLGAGAYADHIDHVIETEQALIEQNACHIWRIIVLSFVAIGAGVSIIAFLASSTFSRQLVNKERRLRQAQQRASQNEHLFRTLIAHLPQKILLKDIYSRFVYCNEKYAKSASMSVEELIGKTDDDLYASDKATQYIQSDHDVIESDKTVEHFFRHMEAGTEYITRLLKTPVKNEDGRTEGVLCVFEDFTERIRAEEGLKEAVKELENTNQQLKDMQVQLVQNDKLASIGQLAAGIAHEINNPMGFVTSNFSTLKRYIASLMTISEMQDQLLDLLKSEQPYDLHEEMNKIQLAKDEMQIDYIFEDIPELCKDSTEGMKRVISIVKNLRDFSRVDQLEDFFYSDVVKNLKSTLVVANNELKYSTDVITDFIPLPDLYCNIGQLNQVFLNIVVNAAQAIDGQGRADKGTIRIKARVENDTLVCRISDDGPGIAKENLSRIFDPFFTTKPTGKGTGLGLNLSYDIVVNKHKGQLSVESEINQGTMFTITIPMNLQDRITQAEGINNEYDQNSIICG